MKMTLHPLLVLPFAAVLIAAGGCSQVSAPEVKGAVGTLGSPGIRGGPAGSAFGGVGDGLHGGRVGRAMIGSAVHGGSANVFLGFSESLGMKQERLRAEASARADAAAGSARP